MKNVCTLQINDNIEWKYVSCKENFPTVPNLNALTWQKLLEDCVKTKSRLLGHLIHSYRIMIEYKLIPKFRSLWCHQRPGKLTTARGRRLSPRAVVPKLLVTPQWPKSRYQVLFYHDASKPIKFMQVRVCVSRKSSIKLLEISHYGKHDHRPLSQQLL